MLRPSRPELPDFPDLTDQQLLAVRSVRSYIAKERERQGPCRRHELLMGLTVDNVLFSVDEYPEGYVERSSSVTLVEHEPLYIVRQGRLTGKRAAVARHRLISPVREQRLPYSSDAVDRWQDSGTVEIVSKFGVLFVPSLLSQAGRLPTVDDQKIMPLPNVY